LELVFYGNGKNCVNHYVEECHRTSYWFKELEFKELKKREGYSMKI